MNHKLLIAALATGTAMFATGAMAADLPSSAPPPVAYIAPAPVFTWTGFYVGVNAGASFNGSDPTFYPNPATLGGAAPLSPTTSSSAGFTGGGTIGYNWQVNQFVFGVEGDLDYLGRTNVNGTYPTTDVNGAGSYILSGGNQNQLFGTLRGRVGWAVDRALFYATGGVAFGGGSAPNTISFVNTAGGICATCVYTSTNGSNTNIGAVAGAGLEYAFTQNWSGKVEYLHTFYDNRTIVYANGHLGQSFSTSGYNFDTNIVRVGLNYKF
jgi:outer membrane immunogenic protein